MQTIDLIHITKRILQIIHQIIKIPRGQQIITDSSGTITLWAPPRGCFTSQKTAGKLLLLHTRRETRHDTKLTHLKHPIRQLTRCTVKHVRLLQLDFTWNKGRSSGCLCNSRLLLLRCLYCRHSSLCSLINDTFHILLTLHRGLLQLCLSMSRCSSGKPTNSSLCSCTILHMTK